MIGGVIVAATVIAACIWQDSIQPCNDGFRYTSGRAQPSPFHRRWCGWPRWLLKLTTYASLLALGAFMRDWKHALVFCTLPGFWFCATRPTTVDAPAMLLALAGATLFPREPFAGVACACLAGTIHERGPVFAALYAWNPILLVGLVGSGWWRTPGPPDADALVGIGFVRALLRHRPFHDWLGWEQTIFALRGLPLMAAHFGASPAAWWSLAIAWGSRLVGTDLGRFAFWAAPVMVRDLPELPSWMVMLHAVSFRRMG